MKVLDRYLVRELFVPILYSSVSLVFLILVSDVFNNLDELLRHHLPLKIILRYYASLVPYAFCQTIPWATWLATLFLLIDFSFHNEIMAMKAAGLKIGTIVKPIFFVGFLVGILNFLVADRLMPQNLKTAKEIHEIYIERDKERDKNKPRDKIFHDVTYYSEGDKLYYFRTFSIQKKEVEGVVVLWLGNKENSKRQKVVAKRGVWKKRGWEMEGVTEYEMNSRGRVLGEPQTFPKKIYPEMRFSPEDLITASSEGSFLTYNGLKNQIRKLKENGVQVISENVDLHSRLSAPWQGLVMMMVTVPLIARTANRRLIALHVLFCVALIFIYHVTGAVSVALGKAGRLFPFVSVWAGNLIFGGLALGSMEKANY